MYYDVFVVLPYNTPAYEMNIVDTKLRVGGMSRQAWQYLR
jgi:hypothetical protein